MIMRNHGLLTCGATIQQAFNTMYQLEMSCRSQVDAMAARAELTMPGENVLAHTAHLYQPGTRRPYGVAGMAGDAAAPRRAREEFRLPAVLAVGPPTTPAIAVINRHCERSEAIQDRCLRVWIVSSLTLLAMTYP